jgi:hypothetical protein
MPQKIPTLNAMWMVTMIAVWVGIAVPLAFAGAKEVDGNQLCEMGHLFSAFMRRVDHVSPRR